MSQKPRTGDQAKPALASKTPAKDMAAKDMATKVDPAKTGLAGKPAASAPSGMIPTGVAPKGPGGTVPGVISYDAFTNTLIFAHATALLPSTTYTVTLSGVSDLNGNLESPVSWSFTTASDIRTSFWEGAAIPAVASSGDQSAARATMTAANPTSE